MVKYTFSRISKTIEGLSGKGTVVIVKKLYCLCCGFCVPNTNILFLTLINGPTRTFCESVTFGKSRNIVNWEALSCLKLFVTETLYCTITFPNIPHLKGFFSEII